MELAVAAGLEVKVVALPAGTDPADDPNGFEDRLSAAEPYALYRVRLELERAPDPQTGHRRVVEVLDPLPDSPERQEAWRLANDRLGMTVRIRRTVAASGGGAISPKVLAAGERQERDALAGCIAYPKLVRMLVELSPDHFDLEPNRRLRAVLAGEAVDDAETVALRAELDARAAQQGIDEDTGKELLLRLRERHLRRELQTADLERTRELQGALARIREAVGGLT
jgi:hypothetical protein